MVAAKFLYKFSSFFSETKKCLSNEIPGSKIRRKKSHFFWGIGCSSLKSKIRVVDPQQKDLSPEACAHLAPALVKLRDQSDTLAQGGETVDVS